MKRILQIDGGGIMGVMPAMVLTHLEKVVMERYGKYLHDSFDLITGSSTGAIIGGYIAAGVSAEKISDLYINHGVSLFKKRSYWNPANWLRNRYDRGEFIETFRSLENVHGKCLDGICLSEVKTRFLATAFNLCSGRTHFIKSWEKKEQNLKLIDVISWSALSAMYYFGGMTVPDFVWYKYNPECVAKSREKGAVFQDGGQGFYNNTINIILSEILGNGWDKKEKVYILSLGTGTPDFSISFNKAKRIDFLGEILRFPFQARNESIRNQVLSGQFVASLNKNIIFKRINKLIPEKEDGLDKIQYIDKFIDYGKELCHKLDEDDFKMFK